ncbi:TIGR03619 family F420-dependent LLM class oxidoreductase [Nocardioides sp. SYSU D00038]|uniref:TIGR03619 family F420-dependent LLM class oxidoreductase n=1 Tax=Nocardioides sp. SYSU D00038 TaxID=2812554 RepID=UPI001968379A|nr:TIGR03619 family F420-dependent LLM class oxidoreductase [Nocardioides sp. SYSU D00038]
MRFSISSAFLPVDQLLDIARAADRLGYHAIAVPDHVLDLETLDTPYPYTPDGSRRWDTDADWPDPWVLAGAMAAVTSRLRFFTSVYVPAMRSPFQVAKSVGTAAVLSGNRVSLGVGIGWCREEFDLLGADFRTRGRRTDEGLALLEALWQPGWTEFEGEFYSAPRMTMNPTPTAPVPVYVGGLSEIAFARAVRHDGWIGDIYSTDEAAGHAARLRELREEHGLEGDFEVIVALTDAFTPEQFAVAGERGVTEVMTMPWAYYFGLDATPEQKLEGMERFAADVIEPLRVSGR